MRPTGQPLSLFNFSSLRRFTPASRPPSLPDLGTRSCAEGKRSASFSLKLIRALRNTRNVSSKPNMYRRGITWAKWKGVGGKEKSNPQLSIWHFLMMASCDGRQRCITFHQRTQLSQARSDVPEHLPGEREGSHWQISRWTPSASAVWMLFPQTFLTNH